MSNRVPDNRFPDGRGYNNDNYFRRVFPGNVYPAHGGDPGNPLGRFDGLTTNTIPQIQDGTAFSNFKQAYATNGPIIEKIDYTNKHETLHDNIGEKVLDEVITEYRINIDSADRDIRAFPDPLCFTVVFDGLSNGIVRTEVHKHGELIPVNTMFHGTPGPTINKSFKNVKYIRLDQIILPRSIKLVDKDGQIILHPDDLLCHERFVGLVIKELTDGAKGQKVFNTSPSVCVDPFGIILPDKHIGKWFYSGTHHHAHVEFNRNNLFNLKRMTIQFQDSRGCPLCVEHLYTQKELEEAELIGKCISCDDVRHPRNKHLQVYLSFIVGVVEAKVNTQVEFQR